MSTEVLGVGPHPMPWPQDAHYDPKLLAEGDKRNVADQYRYWTVEAIKAALDARHTSLEIAIENIERDFNMGTIVRTANAFNVAAIHIIGRRQWNKRGAMKTDAYMNVVYHLTTRSFLEDVKERGAFLVAVDIVPDATPLTDMPLPPNTILLFGSEASGISRPLLDAAAAVGHIEQRGSTRSLNVGVAAGIAMHIWSRQQR